MTQIEIKKIKDLPQGEFEVNVRSSTVTKHKVTLTQEYYDNLTAGAVLAEELIKDSFEFLLARESNTSIFAEFDLKIISNYFPAYEQEIKSRYLTL